jgi:G6PDH family F420-dependent oxidoreductase
VTRYGYFLSSEEYEPAELVRQARLAEQAGFDALWISDHFHPWLDEQGQSSFVWSVIGAISQVTSLPITTAVTCPIMRMHPALVAQGAATAGLLTNGRFNLGLGSGEALNEHIVGQRWPGAAERLEMLEEAIGLIKELFTGDQVNHRGQYFTAETARLYSVATQPPPIYLSGFGRQSALLAARIADGYITMMPDADMVRLYRDSGGGDRPVQAEGELGPGRRPGPQDDAPALADRRGSRRGHAAAPAAPALRAARRARHRGHDLRAVRPGPGRLSRRAAPVRGRGLRRGVRGSGGRRARGVL